VSGSCPPRLTSQRAAAAALCRAWLGPEPQLAS